MDRTQADDYVLKGGSIFLSGPKFCKYELYTCVLIGYNLVDLSKMCGRVLVNVTIETAGRVQYNKNETFYGVLGVIVGAR